MGDIKIESSRRYHLYIYLIVHRKVNRIEGRRAFELSPRKIRSEHDAISRE